MEGPKNQSGPVWALVGVLMPAFVVLVFQVPDLFLTPDSPIAPYNFLRLDWGAALLLFWMQVLGPVVFIVGCVLSWLFWSDLLARRKRMFMVASALAVAVVIAYVAIFAYWNKQNEPTALEVYCGNKYRYANTDEGVDAYYRCMDGNDDGSQTQEATPQDPNQLQVRPPNPL